jgi:phage terminase large subunit GpA-like protein
VQGNRLEVKVKAYGRGQESWLVDYQNIYYPVGHTKPTAKEWDALIALRDRAYPHAGGATVRVTAMGIDSGYLTQEVYDFCRKWSRKHVIATKGQSQRGKPIMGRPSPVDVKYDGKTIKDGVQLWPIGADTAKEMVYARLANTEAGAGYMHFPIGMPDEYYEGLTAETLIRKRVRGVDVNVWVKQRERNEPLDLEIGCLAVAIYAGIQRANWDLLEQLINPTQRDLFVPAPVQLDDKGADAEATAQAAATDAAPPTTVQTSAPRPIVSPIRRRRVRHSGITH